MLQGNPACRSADQTGLNSGRVSAHSKRVASIAGFTLIELLVVISIIALLIGLLLPALARARSAARVTACLGNLRNIAVGTENYSSRWGGVIATGVPPEIKSTHAGRKVGTVPEFQTPWDRLFNWGGGGLNTSRMHYGAMDRYWFLGLASDIAQEDSAKAVWADTFFCPDDNFYSARAEEMRTTEDPRWIHRISYLMSDTAFWDPDMFTQDNIDLILKDNQLYNDSENNSGDNGPAKKDTPGRRYLQKSQVKFPDSKVYIHEVNAFHLNATQGYNVRGMKGTALFYDGHAENVSASSTEKYVDQLFLPKWSQMGWTDPPLDKDDPLYWYYSATRLGIRGRDFIK